MNFAKEQRPTCDGMLGVSFRVTQKVKVEGLKKPFPDSKP